MKDMRLEKQLHPITLIALTLLTSALIGHSNTIGYQDREAYMTHVKELIKDNRTYTVTRPLNLKGLVVDDQGQALEGATVTAKWLYMGESTMIKRNYHTDSSGYFEIKDSDAIGRVVFIEAISLKGHQWLRNTNQTKFNYGDPSISDYYIPQFDAIPRFTLFDLSKASSIYRSSNVARLKPIVDSTSPHRFPLTNKQGLRHITVTPTVKNTGSYKNYPWSLRIQGLRGTRLCPSKAKEAPIAPLGGYVEELYIEYKGDEKNWESRANLEFYYKLEDQTYGKCSITTTPKISKGREKVLISVKYDYNPGGSRILVYDPSKRVLIECADLRDRITD